MAKEPSTKRAKRSHLVAEPDEHSTQVSFQSSSPSPASGGAYPLQLPSQPDYGFSYDFVDYLASPKPNTDTEQTKAADEIGKYDSKEAQEDQSYEFRLFSSTKPAHIILPRSPSPSTLNTSGSILRPRPNTYYLTSSLPASVFSDLRSQYADAAVNGTDITHAASRSWPGTKTSWKVTRLPAFAKQIVVHRIQPAEHASAGMSAEFISLGDEVPQRRRTKPNKKRRILTRTRQASTLAARKREDVRKAELEQREKEKKGKLLERNREKQRKKRERLKLKAEQHGSVPKESLASEQEVANVGGGSRGLLQRDDLASPMI